MSEISLRNAIWHYMDAETVSGYGPWVRHVDAKAAADVAAERIAALEAQLAAAEARSGDLDARVGWLVNYAAGRHRAGWDAAMKAAGEVARTCERQNGPLSKRGFPEDYRRGLESAGQAIAAAILAIPYPGDEG